MCRLFPCITILGGEGGKGGFVKKIVKIVKKICMYVGVKNHIVTCEKCMFWCEKRYK